MGARVVSQDQQAELVRLFLKEDVQVAIKGLNAEGATSPDGLHVFFYNEFWGLVRSNVMVPLEEFRHSIDNMMKINRSHLFLLLKHLGANRVEDFRPILFSNSIYLIFAKVLVNRLRGVIGELVGPFQSAFIPGRLLIDSVTVASEIITTWQRKGTRGFMWKVDFAKAYDSLD